MGVGNIFAYLAGGLPAAGGGIWPLLASMDLSLNVEPGPRCVGGFSKDFLELSGDVRLLEVADDGVVGVVDVPAVDWMGGKGMCDCLPKLADGENPLFSDAPEGGVVAAFDDVSDF